MAARHLMDKSTTKPTARCVDIFPPGFDSKPSQSKSLSSNTHYAFQSKQLYTSLVAACNPRSLADTIVVVRAWYGKRTKSKLGHEFLVIEVKDMANEGLANFMILDRNAKSKTRTPGITTAIPRSDSESYSTACRAEDQFRVSYDGKLPQLLADCGFKHRQMLEKIEFSSETPFYLYELVTMADTVSGLYPSYTVADTNCYLYAGLIWECMRRAYPGASYESDNSNDRGKFIWFRLTPEGDARDRAYTEFQARLPGVRRQIKVAQEVHWVEEADGSCAVGKK